MKRCDKTPSWKSFQLIEDTMVLLKKLPSERFLLILIACSYGCSAHEQLGVGKEVSLRFSDQYVKDYRAQGNEPFWRLEVFNGISEKCTLNSAISFGYSRSLPFRASMARVLPMTMSRSPATSFSSGPGVRICSSPRWIATTVTP